MRMSAFMYVCMLGHEDVVEILLGHPDIDVNARNPDGMTALMIACKQYGRTNIVKLLLQKPSRVDLSFQNNDGQTALWLVDANPFLEKETVHINTVLLAPPPFFKHIIQNCSISKLNEGYYQIEPKLAEARAGLICRLGQT